MQHDGLPTLYTEQAAAEWLGVSLVTLRRYRHLGQIEYTMLSKRKILYTAEQLTKFVDNGACCVAEN